jgi:hypothetical protein
MKIPHVPESSCTAPDDAYLCVETFLGGIGSQCLEVVEDLTAFWLFEVLNYSYLWGHFFSWGETYEDNHPEMGKQLRYSPSETIVAGIASG